MNQPDRQRIKPEATEEKPDIPPAPKGVRRVVAKVKEAAVKFAQAVGNPNPHIDRYG